MAFWLRKLFFSDSIYNYQNLIIIRFGHHIRGKPPTVAKNLQQRFKELNIENPELNYRVNIGFSQPKISRSEELSKRLKHIKNQRNSPEIEKLARKNDLKIDLDEVKSEWLRTCGPYQIREIADHYGIYERLFGDAYFIPYVPLDITYTIDNNHSSLPVYYGNIIKPCDTKNKPNVNFKSDPNSLWTLVLTNPDGHFTKQNAEYVHWLVGNIQGDNIESGETIIEYLQPFPPRGTGFHRLIFVLYKHNKPIDYRQIKRSGDCLELEQRTFSTLEFYRERQDYLTPGGIAFFQCDWDPSLTEFFHKTLNMREPTYEYDFPPPYIRPQTWFPLRQPFNIYMDKYRDPKKIKEEYFLRKLKSTHPFKGPKSPLQYPNAEPLPKDMPSWLKTEIRKQRLGWGRINDV